MKKTPRRRARRRRFKLFGQAQGKVFLGLLLVCLGYGAYRVGAGPICGALVKLERVFPASLTLTLPAEALVIPSEYTVKAPSSGTLKMLVEDGARVRVGSRVAEIASFPGSDVFLGRTPEPLTAPCAGILRLGLDGLEGALTRERLRALGGQVFFQSGGSASLVRDGERVDRGVSLFKIVEPGLVEVAALVPASYSAEIEAKGERGWTSLRLPSVPDAEVPASVKEVVSRPGDECLVVIFQVDLSPERLGADRRIDIEIVRGVYSGISVPRRCIVEKDGIEGVYVASAATALFRPVEVKAVDGQSAIVDGLEPGDEVVLNPWLVRDGMVLR